MTGRPPAPDSAEDSTPHSPVPLTVPLFISLTHRGWLLQRPGIEHKLELPELWLLHTWVAGVDASLEIASPEVASPEVAVETAVARTVDALQSVMRSDPSALRDRLAPLAATMAGLPFPGSPPLVHHPRVPRALVTASGIGSGPQGASAAPWTTDTRWIVSVPRAAAVTAEGFLLVADPTADRADPTADPSARTAAHSDVRPSLALDPIEASVLAEYRVPSSAADLEHHLQADSPDGAAPNGSIIAITERLAADGLLEPLGRDQVDVTQRRAGQAANELAAHNEWEWRKRLVASSRTGATAKDGGPGRAGTNVLLTRVFPVYDPITPPNLALGLILAYAKVHDGGRLNDHYDLDPYWLVRRTGLRRLVGDGRPAVFLFSSYVWSHDETLAISAAVKAASPNSICIHGGPNTPKYEADTERFFADNPHVDVCVRMEGEHTVAEALGALAGQVGTGPDGTTDLDLLAGVPGLAYRSPGKGGAVVRTADRDRIVSLDELPSPYLTGLFDAFTGGASPFVILETNRGCPYGCTFCDWGSATLSRVRQFSLDRVLAELDWVAANRIDTVWLADANFGILARDVEIAAHVAELHRRTGYPKAFETCWTKNTTKYVERIIAELSGAGVVFDCTLALQTSDPGVLATIKRKNIPDDQYDRLTADLRAGGAAVVTDLMMGLPGSTIETFADDLQTCVERAVYANVNQTMLLVNSPMNEPGYRTEHQIEWEIPTYGPNAGRSMVVATSTYSRHDHHTMSRLRTLFRLGENVGLLRHVMLWGAYRSSRREIDLYRRLDAARVAEPERFPALTWLLECTTVVCPPLAWELLLDEVLAWLAGQLSTTDDLTSEIATVRAVQCTLLPDHGRQFPVAIDLPHDYAAWYLAVREVRDERRRDPHAGNTYAGGRPRHGDGQQDAVIDWRGDVPSLAAFPPASFRVDDPDGVNERLLGATIEVEYFSPGELVSPVSRMVPRRHAVL